MLGNAGSSHGRAGYVAAVVAAALALSACSTEDEPAASPTRSATESVFPLTGMPAPDGLPDRPVLVVKVDNTAAAQPQVGLSAADLIVEELVEGGLTRLAVMYHSQLPDVVAPVRSVRTSDVGIVAPTGGAIVGSGGAQRVLRHLREAGLVVLTESDPGFSRDPSRRSPYNLTVAPAEALTEVAELDPPPVPYLSWASAEEAATPGTGVSVVSVRFSAAHTTRWHWTGETWSMVDDLAAEGAAFRPDNIFVLRVTTRDAGYTDPAGNPVPETVLEGTGEALLFSDGGSIRGQWSKADAGSPFVLTDESGAEIAVPPGKTWVELVPEQGSVTTD